MSEETPKKAYDFADLTEKLKAEGLDLAEAGATKVYAATKAWLKESASLSENKFDDLVVPFLDQLDVVVMPQIDLINGKQDLP